MDNNLLIVYYLHYITKVRSKLIKNMFIQIDVKR